MSRVGKRPIPVPGGVKVAVSDQEITVTGPKGTLKEKIHPAVSLEQKEGVIQVNRKSDSKSEKALHGLTRSLIANMVTGVTQGYRKALLITGMGYRGSKQGSNLALSMGYSHPVIVKPASGIEFKIEGNRIIVEGISKQQVGQTAAGIRNVRIPDTYKGKGILYEGERLTLKPGKAGKGATAGSK